MQSVKEKQNHAYEALKEVRGYKNPMAAPRLEKVVISSSFGSARDRKHRQELIRDRLTKITGQVPSARPARKSIASFKVREGEPLGLVVTLRGARMHAFLDKLIHVAIPRMRDFKGLKRGGIDEMGNYTMGITEHTIFPETSDEELKDVFGIAVTVATTATTREEAEAFLTQVGFPFAVEGGVPQT